MSSSAPISAIVAACSALPASIIEAACRELDRLPDGSPPAALVAVSLSTASADSRRTLARALTACTSATPPLTPRQVAAAFRAAAGMDEYHRRHQSAELIWTGPESGVDTLRRTEEALVELINAARHRLWLLTFVAYRVERVMKALTEAAARGVEIRIVAESGDSSGGKTAFGAADAIGPGLGTAARVYIWPNDERPRDQSGRIGSLHAKGALADEVDLLVTSANLTDFAFHLNIELGVVIHGGDLPRQVAAHLEDLVRLGILRPI